MNESFQSKATYVKPSKIIAIIYRNKPRNDTNHNLKYLLENEVDTSMASGVIRKASKENSKLS